MATITGQTMADLLKQLYEGWRKAKETGLGKLEEVAKMYGPGYMAGQERTAIAGAEQAMIGRGLSGTTRPMAVSAGMRTGFEDVRRTGRAGAMTNIANFIAGMAPQPATLAHLATGGFSGLFQERLAERPGGPLGPALQGGVAAGGGGGYGGGGGVQAPLFQDFTSEFRTPFDRNGGGAATATQPRTGIQGSPYGEMMQTSQRATFVDPKGYSSYEGYAAAARAAGTEPLTRSIWQGIIGKSQFGPPTSYYGAGGGWQDWETTGGKITR